LEDQWDGFIPSEIASDRVMGKDKRKSSDRLSMAVLIIKVNMMQEHSHDFALEETHGWLY